MGRLNLKRFQVLMSLLWFLTYMVAITQSYSVFLNYNPEWRCGEEGDFGHNCTLLAECADENLTFSAPFFSASQEFRLLCGQSSYYGTLMTTLMFVGVLLGALLLGQMGDVWGRKWVSIGCLSLGSASFFVSASAPSWQVLTAFRIISGIASGGSLAVVCGYVNEILAPEQRYFLRGVWSWGWARMILVIGCYFLRGWRQFFVAQGIVVFVPILIILCLVPESPKFLATKHRYEELERALERIARFNGEPRYGPSLKPEIKATEQMDEKRVYTVRDLFSTKTQMTYTLVMWLMWFTTSLCGWANELNSGSLAGDFYVNQFLYCFIFGICKTAMFVFDTMVPGFTRRMLHQGSQAVVVTGYLIVISLMLAAEQSESHKSELNLAVTVICIISTQFIEFGWDACYICAVEVFPTVVRTTGIGTSSMWARVGAMIAPQMIFLRRLWLPAPYATVVVVGLISLIVSIRYLPETKGTELRADLPSNSSASVLEEVVDSEKAEDERKMIEPVLA